jgi:hypothetical protein
MGFRVSIAQCSTPLAAPPGILIPVRPFGQ